ncbi:MAG: helix-turn-helix transcriptional regulator [Caulobacterales bacterium]
MSEQTGLASVFGRIYRGAHCSGSWEPALSEIMKFFNASGASLRISGSRTRPVEFIVATGRKIRPEITREWEAQQRRIDAIPTLALNEARIRVWAQDLPDSPIVDEFHSYDIAITMSHCFAHHNEQRYVLSVMRAPGEPSFTKCDLESLQQIGMHFREAFLLRQELMQSNLTRQFQANALDRLGIAGILIDPFGNVLPLNDGAKRLLAAQDVLSLHRNDSLTAAHRASDVELQSYLRKILNGEVREGRSFAMTLERRNGGRPVGAIISSARSMCVSSHREESCALIFMRDHEAISAIEAPLVQKLFSFTPAEANLAIGLASGQRLEEIEGKLNIRHNTARAHLRSMFLKANVSRQAELVYLLANSVASLGQVDDAVQ